MLRALTGKEYRRRLRNMQPFISGFFMVFMYLGTFGQSIKTQQVRIKESLKKTY